MIQIFQNSACRIMQECSSMILNQKSTRSGVKKILETENISINKPSPAKNKENIILRPLQQYQNAKTTQKLKIKMLKRKKEKQVFIRKTDLGQSQLIFTPQELQKLKKIDQEELFQQNNLHKSNNTNIHTQNENGGQKKYFKKVNLDNPKQEISNYLSWVDINQFQNGTYKNKNKILNFQKRQSSLPNLYHNYQPNKHLLPNLLPKYSSPNTVAKNSTSIKTTSCAALMKKNSVDKGFLNSLGLKENVKSKNTTQKQKLSKIIQRSRQKILKQLNGAGSQNKYIYMTQQRKQAILQCQILRRIKAQLGPKFYNKLQLAYGNKQKSSIKEQEIEQNKQNIRKNHSFLQHNQSKRVANWKGNQIQQSQSQKIIQKNIDRLKQQRKRVIQKIVC